MASVRNIMSEWNETLWNLVPAPNRGFGRTGSQLLMGNFERKLTMRHRATKILLATGCVALMMAAMPQKSEAFFFGCCKPVCRPVCCRPVCRPVCCRPVCRPVCCRPVCSPCSTGACGSGCATGNCGITYRVPMGSSVASRNFLPYAPLATMARSFTMTPRIVKVQPVFKPQPRRVVNKVVRPVRRTANARSATVRRAARVNTQWLTVSSSRSISRN